MKPALDSFGDKVFYAGEIGAGSVAKLVHNMIGHSVRQAIAEGLTLGVKAGVGAGGVVGVHPFAARWAVCGYSTKGWRATMFRGEFEPAGFALNLAFKDISLATELAREYDVPMPMSTLAEQIAMQAMNRGLGRRRQQHNRAFAGRAVRRDRPRAPHRPGAGRDGSSPPHPDDE